MPCIPVVKTLSRQFEIFFLAHLSCAQDELYSDQFLFVVRPFVSSHFQMTSPLKLLSQFCSNFIGSLVWLGERNIAKKVTVR